MFEKDIYIYIYIYMRVFLSCVVIGTLVYPITKELQKISYSTRPGISQLPAEIHIVGQPHP